MISNVTNLLENRRLSADDNYSAERAKIDARKYSLLQLFVETPWEKEEIKNLPEWLKKQGIDLDCPKWHYLWKHATKGSGPSQLDSNATDEDIFKDRITTELLHVLPLILKCDDDVNFIDEKSQTILHAYFASNVSDYHRKPRNHKSKILGTVKSLIEKGASVDLVDNYGRTPLHTAALNNKLEIVRLMLNLCSVVDVCDVHACTLLHHVVDREPEERDLCLEIVRILLAKGADPNAKNRMRMTPLQLAVANGHFDLLRIFKENGADFGVTTRSNENLLLLSHKGRNASDIDDSQIVDYLAKEGCDVNARNDRGESPLYLAVRCRRSFIDKLVELGADVNCQTPVDRRTPLHCAAECMSRYGSIVKLCRAGADLDATDSAGRTPLDVALENVRRMTGLPEIALKLGADISKRKTVNAFGRCSKRVRDVVLSHADKLRMLGLPIHGVYEAHLRGRKVQRDDYRERCLEEVLKMKNYAITDGTSIYRFLHANWRCQLACVERLPRELESEFPILASFVHVARNKAVRRGQLFEPAKAAWYRATKIYLPDICVERILYFLDNWHLKVFIDAARAEKTVLPRKVLFCYSVPENYDSLCRVYSF